MKFLSITLLASILLTSCFNTERIDSEAIKEEMASRKITRIKQSDLIVEAEVLANKYLKIENQDSLNAIEGVSIQQYTSDNIDTAPALISQLYAAYTEAISVGQNPGSNIQHLKDTDEYLVTNISQKDAVVTLLAVTLSEKHVINNK